MRSVRRCWVVVIALLALGAGRAAAQPIAFETPAVVDPIHTFGEPPGGGDTEIAFARDGTQFFSDLYALICFRVAVTKDGGANVDQNVFPGGCAGQPGADRQWLAVYDPAPGTPKESAYTGATPLVY